MRIFGKLSRTQVFLIAGGCAFSVFLPTVSVFSDLTIVKFFAAFANAFAVYVTVSGILPLRGELEKIESRIENLMIAPLVEAAKEDEQLVEEIKNCFGKVETGTEQFVKNLQELLRICEKENKEQLAKEIESCLEKIRNIGTMANENVDYSYYETKLKDYKVIVVLYYNNPDPAWIPVRMRLYKKLGILNRVIICTNKGKQMKDMLVKADVKVEVVESKQLNCERLKSAIDKKMGQQVA
ncbi:MAG: hypothetical protein BWK78_04310 [Thiotrichaceae bacterium IS1]|nr:MAG: hypothetical protein BWK78_04310 [Thiotrichaceae bacterium IS1]